MSNNNYDAFRTFIEGRFGFGGGAEHEERRTGVQIKRKGRVPWEV